MGHSSAPGRATTAGQVGRRLPGGQRMLAAAGLILAVVLIGGCGTTPAPGTGAGAGSSLNAAATSPKAMASPSAGATPSTSPSGTPGGTAAPATSATPAMCAISAVTVQFDTAAAGAAAGTSYVPLQFRNVSGRRCIFPEFPAVRLAASSAGPDIGAPAFELQKRDHSALLLRPGRFVHVWLQISSAANYPPSSCRPVTAHGLLVSLTEPTPTAFVSARVPTCSKIPHSARLLAVFPVQAGQAERGTAP